MKVYGLYASLIIFPSYAFLAWVVVLSGLTAVWLTVLFVIIVIFIDRLYFIIYLLFSDRRYERIKNRCLWAIVGAQLLVYFLVSIAIVNLLM